MSEPFETLLERRGNGSMKWEKAYIQKRFGVHEDEAIFPLFIADMDYRMDNTIHTKMMENLNDADFGYFHIQDRFYQSIIDWQKCIHQLDVKKEWILPSIGTVTSLNLACDIYARNEGILMLTPVYGAFQKCANVGTCVTLPLLEHEGRYDIDFDGMKEVFATQNIKVLLFCNPHNPSGRIWSKTELSKLVEVCKEYNVTIISDEIHSDLNVGTKEFISLFSFSDGYDRIIISTSPNKTFNLSGLCTSYILCKNTHILQEFQAYMDHLHLSCNRMGVMMSELAYTYGYDWYLSLIKQIKTNLNIVYDTLSKSDMDIMIPDSGYLIWVRLKHISDVDAFVMDLANATKVLLETGSRFVDHYDGWIRINVATSSELLKEAMKRFLSFYQANQRK